MGATGRAGALSLKALRELRGHQDGSSNRLAKAIELATVTQQALAEATGLTQAYVSNVARQQYETITVTNAYKFARFFGCAIEDLFPAPVDQSRVA